LALDAARLLKRRLSDGSASSGLRMRPVPLVHDMGVDQRGADVVVAEQFWHRPNVVVHPVPGEGERRGEQSLFS
jgi:hypothetical protein